MMSTDWLWPVAIVLACFGWVTAMVDRKENEMARRYGKKHWFLFEMPWHADGVHTGDSPLDLIICNGPNERSWQARRLEYFGRISMDAGSWEARRYMQNALVVLAPDVADSVSFKTLTMDELIDLYKRHCLGNVPLFD